MTFIEHLVQRGLVAENQVGDILRIANEKYEGNLEDSLIEHGVPENTLLGEKSAYYNIPTRPVDPKTIRGEILKYIPEDAAIRYRFAPIGIEEGVLLVGITNPENTQSSDALQFVMDSHGGMPFKLYVISERIFKIILGNYHGMTGQVDQALSELDTEIAKVGDGDVAIDEKPQDKLKPGEEERIVEEAPIIKIVAVILNNAVEGNASDIHIENTGDKVKVRFRVDGVLHTSLVLPLSVYAGVIARIKILSKLRLDEKRKPQDGGFSATINTRKIDFRVSSMPSYYGEKIVMRILDADKGVKTLAEVGLSQEHLAMIKRALDKPYGLILVTGPTGSGKSTTIYSVMNELDREKENIVSLEDPVEYHIPDINQSQVMPEIGYTFASGLRSILRQDPDIIMVGEIRDAETAELAIQAALTGHLVLSTLHTNNAAGVVPRLVDMGIDPYLIAPVLILCIAQRLARITCPSSRKIADDQEALRQMAAQSFADLPPEFSTKLPQGDFTQAVPSAECPSGTRGRVAVFEMYETDKDLQALILKKPTDVDIYNLVRSKGFLTMKENAILKCIQGEIPFQEIYNL
ncbi:MAG: type II/IV secretion system protein [Candidatus Pacebacteria bacterium]|nr:type II/IV secretion system protein [Candidatus Paceibacterota bacterium]